ncbi:MAG TPA: peptidoglycan DD-metalloendopeptidase family protein [Candidatus Saccharimonadales bacterium]|nr:peptidoglycan DD-metalloendopeptidase family protein [Candidatus Saccharimonadales bacterium]
MAFIKRFWWVGLIVIVGLGGTWAIMTFVVHPKTGNNSNNSNQSNSNAPEQRISISLPFPASNDPYGIMPMGETVHHSAPIGHPGIDFFWHVQPVLTASFDGAVTSISKDKNESSDGTAYWVVLIQSTNGQFVANYGELVDYNQTLAVGSQVKQGDSIGHPHDKGNSDFMTHWSFQTSHDGELTLCPLTYFDSSSLARLDAIWANTTLEAYADKNQFPKICNGVFDGLDSIAAHDQMRQQLGLNK